MWRQALMSFVLIALVAACRPAANVEQERAALLAADSDCSKKATDADAFVTCFTSDASILPHGMPLQQGTEAIRETFTKFSSLPGFALSWNPTKADVTASGDLGYTVGTYRLTTNDAAGQPVTENGKYVSIWKKQAGGDWKVVEDIFNSDTTPAPPEQQHALVNVSDLTWGDPPPALPRGAKFARVSGDPTKAGSFVIRLQFPAGYKVAAHWHPTDEHVTVLSGTLAVGHGDSFDTAALHDIPAGGFAVMPAGMRHFAMAKTAATIQVHGMGPFVLNYVNPADDPRQNPS